VLRRESASALTALRREASAIARQARLMRHDLFSVVPADAPDDVVVLVHGLLATAGVLRPLAERLERDTGARAATFTHLPGEGIERIARRVADLIVRLPARTQRVHLVGHSIGGLAARHYVEVLGGDPRVVQTVSIASPFSGVPRASLVLPGQLAKDLDPSSSLLVRLRAGVGQGVPHFSIAGSHDALVASGALPSAERLEVPGCGHNALLYDPVVLDEVVSRVRAAGARGL
jgi:pimeloyl-ACP methyl ester carboxylesterase